MRHPVTLQINLAPTDYRHALHLLPHQLRAWREQVSELLLVVDLRKGAGRFAEGWDLDRERILERCRSMAGARVVEVDYSESRSAEVSSAFFGGAPVPLKDHRGGPYYSYFFGLHLASHDYVLHSDADMFFGGGSGTWLGEALALYEKHPEVLVTAPLPGPPSRDGSLAQLKGTRATLGGHPGWLLPEMSTRLFLLKRSRLRDRVGPLKPRPPHLRARLAAWIDGNPAQELPEELFSSTMRETGLLRFEFAGTAPGCWSLHPPFRSEDFYERLPELIHRVETGDLPAGQLGDHDLNESLVDWSEARRRMTEKRWWKRLRQRIQGART